MAQTIDTNDSRYRAAVLAAQLARYYPDAQPHSIAVTVRVMQNAARSAVRYETNCCNFPDWKSDRADARLRRTQTTVNERLSHRRLIDRDYWSADDHEAALAPATIRLGGDARGPCATLLIPGQRGDGFGDGFAIY